MSYGFQAKISEVEFFQPVLGTRISPLIDVTSLPRGAFAGKSVLDTCGGTTYGCSKQSVWPVVAKNLHAWGCEDGSSQYSSTDKYAHYVCDCAPGWEVMKIPVEGGTFRDMRIICIRV